MTSSTTSTQRHILQISRRLSHNFRSGLKFSSWSFCSLNANQSLTGSTFMRRWVSSSAHARSSDATTHFGFETVSENEKEGRVREVFERVAESYDVMNDLMSGGLHRYWKDYFVDKSAVAPMARAVRRLRPVVTSQHPQPPPQTHQHYDNHPSQGMNHMTTKPMELRILDVAGGTGDVAFRMIDAAQCVERAKSTGQDPVSVTVCDINHEMLRVGERRARERYAGSSSSSSNTNILSTGALSFCQGNAQSLDVFTENTFDLYTIAFGLRNVTDIDQALREAFRVLKPGGRFLCLEFSQVPSSLGRAWYDAYSFHVIPFLGEMVAHDRASYQYLVESIRRFPDQEQLNRRLADSGFTHVTYTNLTGGIVAIHDAWKPL